MVDKVEQMVRAVFHQAQAYGPDAEARIREIAKLIRVGKVQNPEGYAYIAARNFTVDRLRKVDAMRRAQEEAERRRVRAAYIHSMCSELWMLVQSAPVGDRQRAQEMRQVLALHLEGYDTVELMRVYGVSRDVVYQWRKRALDQLEPYMSDELRKFIGRGKYRRVDMCRRAD